MRVLVAEDDPGLRSVLERGLRRSGYVVDAVADGDRALLFLRSYDYEVAVLDWRMPGVSGLDVVQEVRRRGSKVPVLLLTARDTTEDRVEGLDGGADDYLVKPFEFARAARPDPGAAAAAAGRPRPVARRRRPGARSGDRGWPGTVTSRCR